MSTPRIGRIERVTRESSVTVEINLDGTGVTEVDTGLPFFDHMLTAFGTHGSFDLTVHADGDTEVDAHHTVEDTAIVLGSALARALGDKRGIRRFADSWIPMDETLVQAVVDVSGRPYYVGTGEPDTMLTTVIGGHYATVINQHFFESLAFNAKIALHVRCIYGRDPHHVTEAEFKAVARALRAATESDPRVTGVPSTKGTL
ncbi:MULTISPECIES: imidazoleglycerol-phosphate dehydratase HisB [Corynebacterium]|uniref:Imidazoleglycerol-phosphate dehydratase n=1 Tax=Corynebacterium provencense TaxID=1737425 RepID=A0A2Z3YYK2_9CORY|nr:MULTISPECIES: imidazoleglycerol-phosphate dehydratase HisB [Corynebacterium]AWT26393.1 Imidazoleglycerol-phosphate dehydratase [Corynebacterium provencense]MCI1256523.1 imidazoleglycerol-phosphate dehydratase HisB [Corynebacterium provencense]